MNVFKSFFQIGIYDPLRFDKWPWHYEYEYGMYLSAKKRVCGWNKPAEFDTEKEAREFFHSWKQKAKYKMEIIEVKRSADIPDPVFPEDHPRTIMEQIVKNEKSSFRTAASLWFSGFNAIERYSRPTQLKYRKQLLKYGIDLFSDPSPLLKKQWEDSNYRNYCSFDFKENSKPKLVSTNNKSLNKGN
jgi:hypothetical protein